jgi:OOP family OmpA-OmpF porin
MGLLMSVAAAATIATAADIEFTPVGGYVVKEGNLNLENEWLVGGELQFNGVESAIKPELSVLYTPEVDYDDNLNDTSILRFALNGVYEYRAKEGLVPFAKAGVGFEQLESRLYENDNDVYIDFGAGFKLPLSEMVALKVEALYMLKDPFDHADNSLAALVGLSFGFGGGGEPATAETEPMPEPAPFIEREPAPVIPDSDGDGVNDSIDKCPETPMEAQVDATGCPLDGDRDGVIDLDDACPDTPAGYKVDETGCPETMELRLTYETNSAVIDAASAPKVHAFGRFLQENTGYRAHVVGHTDSVGSEQYNMKLSEKRAVSVRNMLVEQGIDASRITTEGRGETDPKADNDTAEGRQENRRIEVQLRR